MVKGTKRGTQTLGGDMLSSLYIPRPHLQIRLVPVRRPPATHGESTEGRLRCAHCSPARFPIRGVAPPQDLAPRFRNPRLPIPAVPNPTTVIVRRSGPLVAQRTFVVPPCHWPALKGSPPAHDPPSNSPTRRADRSGRVRRVPVAFTLLCMVVGESRGRGLPSVDRHDVARPHRAKCGSHPCRGCEADKQGLRPSHLPGWVQGPRGFSRGLTATNPPMLSRVDRVPLGLPFMRRSRRIANLRSLARGLAEGRVAL